MCTYAREGEIYGLVCDVIAGSVSISYVARRFLKRVDARFREALAQHPRASEAILLVQEHGYYRKRCDRRSENQSGEE
jgi:hypothetical protein